MTYKKVVREHGILLLVIVAILTIGGYKVIINNKWSAPYYNVAEKRILLSSKIDELSDEQEEAFYLYTRAAIENELDIDMSNYKSEGIYIEKSAIEHEYYIEYTCYRDDENETTYETKLNIKPEASLKSDSFSYDSFETELTSDY